MKIEDMKVGYKFWIKVEVGSNLNREVMIYPCDRDKDIAHEASVDGEFELTCQADLDNAFVKSLTKTEVNESTKAKMVAITQQITALKKELDIVNRELI